MQPDTNVSVTPEEIASYRDQVKDFPEALHGLDILAACDGDLEAAAEAAIRETVKNEPGVYPELEAMIATFDSQKQ